MANDIGLPARPAARRAAKGKLAVRNPERTRAAILAAASCEFAEKGLGGARVDAIANRAGTNKRMLYHYFGDKEGLYLAVLEETYASIRTAETELDLTHRDPEESIRDLALFTWRYFLDHPEFLSLLNTENLHKARYLRRSPHLPRMHSRLVAEIGEVLRRGEAKGVFRSDVDPLHVYLTIAALGFFYLSNRHTLSAIFGRELTDPEQIVAWGEHIVAVTLAHLRGG